MKHMPREDTERLPDWIRAELAAEDPVDERDLADRFDYLEEPFKQNLRAAAALTISRAANVFVPPSVADALFSLGGSLLEWAEGVAEKIFSFPDPLSALQPAPATCSRGVPRAASEPVPPSAPAEGPLGTPVGQITKVCGEYWVRAVTLRKGQETRILLNVLTEAGGEPRPLTVAVRDLAGRELVPSVTAVRGAPGVWFPGPTEGAYVFVLVWQGGQATLRVDFLKAP